MPIDASIPLAAGNIQGIQPQNLMSMAEFGMAMKKQKQEQQSQNALRSIFANPGNLGPDGMPTQEAIGRMMAIDPHTGMKMQSNILSMAEKRQQMITSQVNQKLHEMGINEKQYGVLAENSGRLRAFYEDMIEKGASKEDAIAQTSSYKAKMVEEMKASGQFNPDQIQSFSTPFTDHDPISWDSNAYKNYRASHKQTETERHNREMESNAAKREANSEARTQRTIAALAGNGKPPAGYRWNKGKPGELEPIPGGPANKAGSTIGGKMNPAMRASVELDMKEINYGLDQIEKLKADKASGFFQDEHEGNALTRYFKKKITPEQSQEYDALANRFAMAIASIQSMGRGLVSDAKINEARKLVPVPGDAKGTVETKLKIIRRISQLAKESLDTPLKGGDRTDADDVQDAVDFSGLWR